MGIFEVPDDRRNSGQCVGSSVGVDPRLLPPPVIIERALARVAGLAQRTEVGEVVGATVTQREHVVDLSSRSRAAGPGAGIGVQTLPPVRAAIGDGHDTKTITLSCGKLTTGVTVKQWSSILMLRNLTSPETYFQAAFRVQSP
jgi:type III restriction system endonuclease